MAPQPFESQPDQCSPGFGDLRSLLQQPSRISWRELKYFVESLSNPEDFIDNQLHYINAHLERHAWKQITREIPKTWIRRLVAGKPVPYIRLCNTFKVHFKPRDYSEIVRAFRSDLWLLDGIRALTLCGDLSPEHLMLVSTLSPRFMLDTLRVIGEEIDDISLANLLTHPCHDELTTLHLQGCKLGRESAFTLAQRLDMNGQCLDRLVLQSVGLQTDHFASILSSRAANIMHTLDLSNFGHHDWSLHATRVAHQNHVNDTCLRLLASADHMGSLEELSLRHAYGITNVGLSYLTSAPHLSGLRHLDLSYCYGLTDDCVDLILDSPHLQNLESLDLSHCMLTEEGVARLNTSLALPSLKRLKTTATGVAI